MAPRSPVAPEAIAATVLSSWLSRNRNLRTNIWSHPAAVFLVLLEDEGVGHAGDVVADYVREGVLLAAHFLVVVAPERFGAGHPEGE